MQYPAVEQNSACQKVHRQQIRSSSMVRINTRTQFVFRSSSIRTGSEHRVKIRRLYPALSRMMPHSKTDSRSQNPSLRGRL